MPSSFRFRPRYRGVAWTAIGLGGSLGGVAVAVMGAALVPIATGVLGIALGASYLASPTWRLEVVVDDDALEVRSPRGTRFRLAWADVVKVVASPSTHTCFVDGGAPERSLLVPGVGAPAPYAIEDRDGLYAAIVARVAPEKVREVETLETAG
ncbi:MAG: hypothetical protein ACM31C_19110 [Acidobacteriota bacterium]